MPSQMYALIALLLLVIVFALAAATQKSVPRLRDSPTMPQPTGPSETFIYVDGRYLAIDEETEQISLDGLVFGLPSFTQEDGTEDNTFLFSTDVNGSKKYLARGQQIVEGVNTLKLVDSKQEAERWRQDGFVLVNKGKGVQNDKVLASKEYVGDSSLPANLPYLVERTSKIDNNAVSVSASLLSYAFFDTSGAQKVLTLDE